MGLAEDGLKKTLGTLIDYLSLHKYVALRIEKLRGVSKEFYKEEDFWKAALGSVAFRTISIEPLPEGAIITLKGFQITEWVPVNPGRYWTEPGTAYRYEAREHRDLIYFSQPQPMLAYDPDGKTYMMLGGMGTVKPKPQRFRPIGSPESAPYSLLCATSSGYCWSGIPILVSDTVYRSFRRPLRQQKKVEADIVGIYQTNPVLPEDLVLSARGEKISNRAKQLITECCGIPQNVIVVESVLNIKKRISEIPIKAVAWTLFQGIKPDNTEFYSFTYHTFNPQDEVSHNIARNFILNYFFHFGGKRILTDYDENRPWFSVFTKKDIEESDRFRKEMAKKHKIELEKSQKQKELKDNYIESEYEDILGKDFIEIIDKIISETPSFEEEAAPVVKNKLGIQEISLRTPEYPYQPYFGRTPSPFLSLKSVLEGSINPEDLKKLLLGISNFKISESEISASPKDWWGDSAPYFVGGE